MQSSGPFFALCARRSQPNLYALFVGYLSLELFGFQGNARLFFFCMHCLLLDGRVPLPPPPRPFYNCIPLPLYRPFLASFLPFFFFFHDRFFLSVTSTLFSACGLARSNCFLVVAFPFLYLSSARLEGGLFYPFQRASVLSGSLLYTTLFFPSSGYSFFSFCNYPIRHSPLKSGFLDQSI